jgi:hypothetical protein
MNDRRTGISDNLPDFSTRLLRVESTYIKDISVELAHARGSVVSALPGFRSSRMQFGRILRAYKELQGSAGLDGGAAGDRRSAGLRRTNRGPGY